jgi:hypothetical protein
MSQKTITENKKQKAMKTIILFKAITVIAGLLLLLPGVSKAMNFIRVSDQGRIYGRLFDFTTGDPLAFISAELFSVADSQLVVGTLSNLAGEFNFSMLKPGSYFVVISGEGFASRQLLPVTITADESKLSLGEIQLTRVSRKHAKALSRQQMVPATVVANSLYSKR